MCGNQAASIHGTATACQTAGLGPAPPGNGYSNRAEELESLESETSVSDNLEDFQNPLGAVLKLLTREKIPHVLIGGLAVSQLSRPRLTADIDVLTYLDDDERIPKLIKAFQ